MQDSQVSPTMEGDMIEKIIKIFFNKKNIHKLRHLNLIIVIQTVTRPRSINIKQMSKQNLSGLLYFREIKNKL